MPLWLSSFRSRTYRWPIRSRISSPLVRPKWQRRPYHWPSYNTALREDLRDEIRAPVIPPSSRTPDDVRVSAGLTAPSRGVRETADSAPLRSPSETGRIESRTASPINVARNYNENRRIFKTIPPPGSLSARGTAQQRGVFDHIQPTFVPRRRKIIAKPRKPTSPRAAASREYLTIWIRQLSKMHTNIRHLSKPITDVRAAEWSELLLKRVGNSDEKVRRADLALYDKDTNYVWVQAALWLLAHDPESMIPFLLATHVEPYPTETLIEGSLAYLSRYWTHCRRDDRALQLQRLADAFCILADRGGEQNLTFFNKFFRTLIRHCSDQQIQNLYRTIKTHNVSTHWHTYLHFATYFAKHDHFRLGLDALMDAKEAGAKLNTYAFRSNCSTLLRKSSEQPDGLRECLRIVSNLVEIGVELDKPIFDIIMLNAVDAGDLKTAWGVYHSLLERELQPTESTFAVLLKGCKMNIDDAETLNETIRDAIANVKVRESQLVATEILHCLALHHSKHNPSTALNTLMEAYAQLFDVQPLEKLGLAMSKPSQQPENFMPPTRHALNFIIGATIDQHLSRESSSAENILALYSRWRTQVEAGEPSLARLAADDYTSNLFLQAFIQRPSSLIHATRVVRDMQREIPGVQQIAPTVQTWSIFLHGFTRHGKTALAEQVLQYMRSKGVEPNLVTWNTLVTGYARAQDEVGVVAALRRAEGKGMVWNRWTHGGLRALKRRQLLEKELESKKLRIRLDFGGELRRELKVKLAGDTGVEGRLESLEEDASPGSGSAAGETSGSYQYRPLH